MTQNIRVRGENSTDLRIENVPATGLTTYKGISLNSKNTDRNFTEFTFIDISPSISTTATGTIDNAYGIKIDNSISTTQFGATKSYGVYSDVNSAQNYNFYSSGSAPNYFQGSTYIGGNTARNTFDLWKSTLTEEQLETLEAGTLVAPANVSLPGDGSFARQWYYDQQNEETQAELDAGTLEYPEHLAAATFTDRFDLGDNTNINLLNNGTGEFVTVKTDSIRSMDKSNMINLGSGSASGMILATKDVKEGSSGSRSLQVNWTTTADIGVGIVNIQSVFNAIGTSTQDVSHFSTTTTTNQNTSGNLIGYRSNIGKSNNAGTGGTYSFYAEGNAPNFFAGDITCNGLINGAFSLRMQSDEPTAFQTTYTTDDEGNEVENQEYIGTTEDLLAIIKDLRDRVAALEAA